MKMFFCMGVMFLFFLIVLFVLVGCDVIDFKGCELGEIFFKLVGVDMGVCFMIMSIG